MLQNVSVQAASLNQLENVNGTISQYVYDNEDIVIECTTNGALKARYTHGPGIDEPLAVKKGSANYYYHADGLGSIVALSNSTGKAVQLYRYDAFGRMTQSGSVVQPYTYTAREYDTETGLYYYRARYYDPKAGRFLTRDPIGFKGGINQYTYVRNNPVNLIDPSGLLSAPFDGLIGNVSSEILGLGLENTIGGITGAICASTFCKRRVVPSWLDTDSECISIFNRRHLPPGPIGGKTNDYVNACSQECGRLTKKPEYKDACMCK